jgi:predicted RNA binding protein YcfA (HicA-like mRNA interferase family)
MSKHDKLKEKLRNLSINADELRTLLKQEGFELARTRGSHQQWVKGKKLFTLSAHGKDLLKYQMRNALEVMYGE